MPSELWTMLWGKQCLILRSWPQPRPHLQAADLYLRNIGTSTRMFHGHHKWNVLSWPNHILTWQPASLSVTCFSLDGSMTSSLLSNQLPSLFYIIYSFNFHPPSTSIPTAIVQFLTFICHLNFFSNLSTLSLVYFHLILLENKQNPMVQGGVKHVVVLHGHSPPNW